MDEAPGEGSDPEAVEAQGNDLHQPVEAQWTDQPPISQVICLCAEHDALWLVQTGKQRSGEHDPEPAYSLVEKKGSAWTGRSLEILLLCISVMQT